MTIQESNRLIARFMGWEVEEKDVSWAWPMGYPEGLRYHESWDWLMPVVKKIYDFRYSYLYMTSEHFKILFNALINAVNKVDLPKAYLRVTEIIPLINKREKETQD